MTRAAFAGMTALLIAGVASAQSTPLQVTLGGFIDTYYAYDFGKPVTLDRSFLDGAVFTTQPARHNEFNINLAYIEAVISGEKVRGRLALQAGTSVQSNYAGEPGLGSISGPTLARHIQEAFAGYQVTPDLWIDGGIFYSHMGMESWASKDNLTYTRSLVAEYSPYYSSGVRATWAASDKLTARVDLVNGWQNISETNTDKGVGLRLDLAASSKVALTYYGFLNGETGGRSRLFNGFGVKLQPADKTTLLGQVDFGSISSDDADEEASWMGFMLIAKQQLTDKVALVGRVERYDDEDQVNIGTGLANPFVGNGGSIGLDVALHPKMLWRTELRALAADDEIFAKGGASQTPAKNNTLAVTSFSIVF